MNPKSDKLLAYKYLSVGFTDEARDLLDDARKAEKCHPNVGSALAKLSEQAEEETEEMKVLEVASRAQFRFLLEFSERLFIPSVPNTLTSGSWLSESGIQYKLDIQNGRISATTSKEEVGRQISETWSGDLENDTAKISVTFGSVTTSTTPSLFNYASPPERRNGYLYLDHETDKIMCMQVTSKENFFVTLTKSG